MIELSTLIKNSFRTEEDIHQRLMDLLGNPFLMMSILSLLIPLSVGIRKRDTLLWRYCLTGFLFEIMITLLRRTTYGNYYIPSNFFLLTEFVIVSFLFKRGGIFKSDVTFYAFVSSLSALFVLTSVHKSVWELNLTGGSLFYFTYILYGIAGLHRILRRQEHIFLDKNWFFWLCASFTIHSAGGFFVFLFRDILMQKDWKEFMALWTYIFLSLNVLKNILISIAIYRYKRPYNE